MAKANPEMLAARRFIGDRLRHARLDKGLSQEALAERAFIRRASISMMETAAMDISATQLLMLARALDCSATYFFPPDSHADTPEHRQLVYLFTRLSVNFRAAALQHLVILSELQAAKGYHLPVWSGEVSPDV